MKNDALHTDGPAVPHVAPTHGAPSETAAAEVSGTDEAGWQRAPRQHVRLLLTRPYRTYALSLWPGKKATFINYMETKRFVQFAPKVVSPGCDSLAHTLGRS